MTKNNKLWLIAAAVIVLVPAALYSVQVLGYQDLQIISAPSNPASGFLRLSAQTGTLSCLTSGGANCLSGLAPGGSAGGDLSGTYPNPTVAKINGASVPTNCALTNSNGSSQLACQTAKGLASVAYAAGAGTANAQTVTYAPAVAALADIVGYPICWLPSNANSTTTPTLAVNGLTAHTIVKAGGAVAANDLLTTAVACVIWDGTSFELQNPQTGGAGASPLTTKGDLYTFSTVNTRLGVGSDGQCLISASGQTTGLQWASCTGGGGGGMTQIGQVTISGSLTSTISFTSIPGSYSALKILLHGASLSAVAGENSTITFNSDTASHYTTQGLYGSNTTAGGFQSTINTTPGATSEGPCYVVGASTASGASSCEITIPDYAGTTFFKAATAVIATYGGSTQGNYYAQTRGVFWSQTSAITRIDLALSSGANWTSGTQATLYGMQ